MIFRLFTISGLPKHTGPSIPIGKTQVSLILHPTGFGERRYFICPDCGARRAHLLVWGEQVGCRGCAPVDIYRHRRNLYDSGGTALIEHHMMQLARKHHITFTWPFDYRSQLPETIALSPARADRFRAVLTKLQALENMRFSAIFLGRRHNAQDIKRYTDPAFTGRYTLQQLRENILT